MPDRDGSVQSPFDSNSQSVRPKKQSGDSHKHSAEEAHQNTPPTGRVYLVGAGPGDPGLLTLRGRECLEKADFVLFDGLASDQMLDFATQAELISVGKHGQIPIWTQDRINERLVELARAGNRVVRLKGGDPAVFARTAEELEVLAREQIDFEVVPGITAALAAASYVGIPITHRHHASAVALITGQQQSGDVPQSIDWDALARFPGTIVFYMGVTTVAEWTSKLISAGKDAQTPAAIIRRCTWNDQAVIRCRLSEVAAHLTPASKMRPPVIVIIGAVAALGEDFDWFASRPLHGCGVLVSRASPQNDGLTEQLRELGAEVFQQPAFEVQPPSDRTSLNTALDAIRTGVDGITFSSSNGVDGLMHHVQEEQHDARMFAGIKLAAVGRATADRLKVYGLRCDVIAGEHAVGAKPSVGQGNCSSGKRVQQNAAGLLSTLGGAVDGQRWIVTTTNRSRPDLSEGLRRAGATVIECLAYETRPVETLRPHVESALRAGRVQFTTITSSFVAEAAFSLLHEFRDVVRPVCFGEAVARKLEQLGWPPACMAESHSSESLVQAIAENWKPI